MLLIFCYAEKLKVCERALKIKHFFCDYQVFIQSTWHKL